MTHEDVNDLTHNPEEVHCSDDLKIKVIGVGGAGSNIVDSLHFNFIEKVDLVAVNTDAQALSVSPLNEKYKIGQNTTRGLSTGGEIEIGLKAAEEDSALLEKLTNGAQLIFVVAGLGGGTGGGVSPKLAEIAQKNDAIVIAFVSMPFTFEGSRKLQQAETSLSELRKHANAVVVLSNDLLLQQAESTTTASDAFSIANKWVSRGIGSIVSILFKKGLINLDFASLKYAFGNSENGRTLFGLSFAEGENYVQRAINDLSQCPLLQTPTSSKRADALLINIVGGSNLSLSDVNQIVSHASESFGAKAKVTVGAVIDADVQDQLEICILGTTEITSRQGKSKESPNASKATITSQETILKHKVEGPMQSELTFSSASEFRGCFEKTEQNELNGEDLDVPTYLRRGIKIKL